MQSRFLPAPGAQPNSCPAGSTFQALGTRITLDPTFPLLKTVFSGFQNTSKHKNKQQGRCQANWAAVTPPGFYPHLHLPCSSQTFGCAQPFVLRLNLVSKKNSPGRKQVYLQSPGDSHSSANPGENPQETGQG